MQDSAALDEEASLREGDRTGCAVHCSANIRGAPTVWHNTALRQAKGASDGGAKNWSPPTGGGGGGPFELARCSRAARSVGRCTTYGVTASGSR